LADRLNNTFQVRHHLLVREAQHAKAFRRQKCVSPLISPLSFIEIVRFSVEFYNKLRREADEIDDVISNRRLATKAYPVHPIGFQVSPQQRFGARHRLAKLLRPVALTFANI
jgi:hypothetical protein